MAHACSINKTHTFSIFTIHTTGAHVPFPTIFGPYFPNLFSKKPYYLYFLTLNCNVGDAIFERLPCLLLSLKMLEINYYIHTSLPVIEFPILKFSTTKVITFYNHVLYCLFDTQSIVCKSAQSLSAEPVYQWTKYEYPAVFLYK